MAGKVVAITGASSGIGEATAVHLASQGAKVVLGARGEDKLKALADRIGAVGGEAVFVPIDVAQRGDLAKLVDAARGTSIGWTCWSAARARCRSAP